MRQFIDVTGKTEDGKPMEGQYVQPDGSISATETKYATDKSALP